MLELTDLFAALDEAHWEFSLIFEELDDADLWRRAHPRLLSVGELAGHVCYGQAQIINQPGNAPIQSPLIDPAFRYYLYQVDQQVVLDLTVEQVLSEMKRIHEECKSFILNLNPDINSTCLGRAEWTWKQALSYNCFHVAYHTGQAFSVRHIFGHTTNDN